jgi:hypothetical protein
MSAFKATRAGERNANDNRIRSKREKRSHTGKVSMASWYISFITLSLELA